MLTEEKIIENKDVFIESIKSISRPNADIDGLINKLENSDFFYAPASVRYFGSYKGGLCEYCLKTFNIMKQLVRDFTSDQEISDDSIIITALFYSLYKMNFYQSDVRNVKVYKDNGSKYDAHGKFDWETQEYYRVKDAEERFLYGTNGETSEFMLRYFIPLTVDESRAIINATRNTEDGQNFLAEVYATSPLTVLLSSAITISNYI